MCQESGKYRDLVDIRMCNEAVKNICSAGFESFLRLIPMKRKHYGTLHGTRRSLR